MASQEAETSSSTDSTEQFFRAVDIIQAAWLSFRKCTFDYQVTSTSDDEENYIDVYISKSGRGDEYLIGSIDETYIAPQHQAAVLAIHECDQAVASMEDFLRQLLSECSKSVKKYRFAPIFMNAPKLIRIWRKGKCVHDSGATGTRHTVFKVQLASGEQSAVDLTSAQYGYDDPSAAIPWETYYKERVQEEDEEPVEFAVNDKTDILTKQVVNDFDKAWRAYESEERPLSELVGLPKEEFVEAREKLLERLNGAVKASVRRLQGACVADNVEEELDEELRGLWLDVEEREKERKRQAEQLRAV